jgi:hypothetical protein
LGRFADYDYKLVIPRRAEVPLPVERETRDEVGVTDKWEIQPGVYLAGTVTRVRQGYAITSILNTTNEQVEKDEPVLDMIHLDFANAMGSEEDRPGTINRPEEVLKRLRLEHLNVEGRQQIEKNMRSRPRRISFTGGGIK